MDKNKELRLWKDYLMMKWEEGCSLPSTHCDCDEPESFACWKKHLSSDEYKVIKYYNDKFPKTSAKMTQSKEEVA